MCGISGIWNLDGRPVERRRLTAMNGLLAHRGPDGEGIHCDGSLGLGHTRLSILDLSDAGHQPMSCAGGRYWITYNGEIYNFLELRRELAGLGHRFHSDSDTEVLLAAYVQWGPDCQWRLNGAWAFAIWDSVERRLFLSRDRFGVRPLHYRHDGRSFAFASEMKAFLALDGFVPELDPAVAARAILDPGAVEGTEDCLFRGIRRLVGGHCLTVAADGTVTLRRWWNTAEHIAERTADDEAAQAEALRETFFDACRLRMRSDVPLATALSGGLDSSAVHATVAALGRGATTEARRTRAWQTAFVASFPDTAYDERTHAQAVVAAAGTRAVVRPLDPLEALGTADRIFFDTEDIYDILAAPWLLYREMRRNGFTVSMDGHGGDELLAGYHHYYHHALAYAAPPLPAEELRTTVERMTVPEIHGHPASPPCPDRRAFLTAEPGPAVYPNGAAGGELMDRDTMTRNMYADFHKRVLPTILRNFDRCSMAHGVEIRAPFLDWRVVCLCFSLPVRAKVRDGRSKAVLRRAMEGLLPPSILNRTEKMGFVSPLEDWLAGPLRQFLLDGVHSAAFLGSPIWDGLAVRGVVDRGDRRNHKHWLRWGWEFLNACRIEALFREQAATLRRRIADGPT